MSTSNYNRQILADVAYGWINATGASAAGFGCSLQRLATGVYAAVVPTGSAMVENQSFTRVTPKFAANGPTPAARTLSVAEIPSGGPDGGIVQWNVHAFTVAGAPVDTDVEVEIRRGTASQYGGTSLPPLLP